MVVKPVPFHLTTDVEIKLVPVTVNMNWGSPTIAELGLKEVAVGRG